MDSIWGLRGMTVAINNAGNVSVLVICSWVWDE